MSKNYILRVFQLFLSLLFCLFFLFIFSSDVEATDKEIFYHGNILHLSNIPNDVDFTKRYVILYDDTNNSVIILVVPDDNTIPYFEYNSYLTSQIYGTPHDKRSFYNRVSTSTDSSPLIAYYSSSFNDSFISWSTYSDIFRNSYCVAKTFDIVERNGTFFPYVKWGDNFYDNLPTNNYSDMLIIGTFKNSYLYVPSNNITGGSWVINEAVPSSVYSDGVYSPYTYQYNGSNVLLDLYTFDRFSRTFTFSGTSYTTAYDYRNLIYSPDNVSWYFGDMPSFLPPSFGVTDEQLINGDFDYLVINNNSYSGSNDITITITYNDSSTVYNSTFNTNSDYWYRDSPFDYGSYLIPKNDLNIIWRAGREYAITLTYSYYGTHTITKRFTVGSSAVYTEEDETTKALNSGFNSVTNAISEQTNAINSLENTMKESEQTNKNIFQSILDLPGQLLNMFLSIFIPGDGFFDTYFSDLMDFFSDRFGFLAYPFELAVSILGRYLNLVNLDPRFYDS